MRKVDLPAGHEVVNSHELATLRRKARAHDAYLWATKRMADNLRRVEDDANKNPSGLNIAFSGGYNRGIWDFAQLVKEAPME